MNGAIFIFSLLQSLSASRLEIVPSDAGLPFFGGEIARLSSFNPVRFAPKTPKIRLTHRGKYDIYSLGDRPVIYSYGAEK
jgi:hypothetical protein